MKRTNLFSGIKPALEDWNFERDADELHIKKRIIDLTGSGTGVLRKIADEIQVYIEDPNQFLIAKVKTGEAYIQGEKIEIDEVQSVSLDDAENYANIVYLKYKLIDSSDPDAVRNHYLTGDPHIVWQEDSFELLAVKESLYVPADDQMKLARVAKVGGKLVVTHDYRAYLQISDQVMNTLIQGQEILFKQSPPPVPTRLRLTTDFEEALRSNDLAGLISVRQAYIKVEFGDWGIGTASGNTFTKTTSQLTWTTNEWAGKYLTDHNNDSYLVVSNTVTVLTLEVGVTPVSGNFWLGPNARAYRFIVEPLHPDTQVPISHEQAELCLTGSPVEMNYIFHGLTPDIKYRVKVASLGGWYQEEHSSYCTPVEIIAGGPKVIPDNCASAVTNVVAVAHDLGLKVTWDIVPVYTEHVAGIELCWTDDGTEPDFTNIGMRKVFTDRNFAILPTQLTTTETTIQVKAKMRCVDTAGRHCITSLAIPAVQMQQYLGSALNIAITTKLQENALGYSSVGAAILAITRGQVAWNYVRIVAKSGGHYASIQAAINDIVELDKYYVIYVMPGKYAEDISIGNKLISIVGLDKVLIDGRIQGGAGLYRLENLRFKPSVVSATPAIQVSLDSIDKRFLLNDVIIDATNVQAEHVVQIAGRFKAKGCTIYSPQDNVDGIGLTGTTIASLGSIEDCRIQAARYPIYLNVAAVAQINYCPVLKAGGANASIYVLGAARIFYNIWNNYPDGTGTLDYGDPDPKKYNIRNDDIEIVLEDDMLSNEV